MMPAPRKYPLELRERAVRMYRAAEPKLVIRRMTEESGVRHEPLHGWIRQTEADAGERDDLLTSDERAGLTALRKEIPSSSGRTGSCGRPRLFRGTARPDHPAQVRHPRMREVMAAGRLPTWRRPGRAGR